MKKQNYINAAILLFLSMACLYVGYWSAEQNSEKKLQSFSKYFESELRSKDLDAQTNLNLLLLLKDQKIPMVEEILRSKVKSHLRFLSKGNNKLRNEALEYQQQYCSDKCLGI